MKRFLLIVGVLLLAGCTKTVAVNPPAPTPVVDHTITLSWSQSEADSPVCSATITRSCLSGYSEGTVSGTTFTSLHTDAMTVCTGTTQPESCTTTFNSSALAIGSVTFGLVLDYIDQNGAAQVLPAVTTATPTTVAADAPTSLVATVK